MHQSANYEITIYSSFKIINTFPKKNYNILQYKMAIKKKYISIINYYKHTLWPDLLVQQVVMEEDQGQDEGQKGKKKDLIE